ncbi:MAG: tRNA (uridine(34)/cytosine(34)/5-carboxymethylaminomethyluridine(34)-2'-O)-methyltransferase TrmL [Ectothiorhodospiraceae bacterium]|nr:tRNA (uridine(34)/cytosine(34)/5-carboxymethylaminomethyluridine(34)-2'-O)-methyltransferase TrmL [Ectothiorhodospiraceae bacterium]MCH8504103.1 tRNA (uridine(34)/cytosine(34)/5-carboxymethylaminomethyluridine(34)-2'-O)-methyltransferase TrmL [Ectothiorhodospiraceae bacterium]
MFDVVLLQPEIPPNTGNVIRLCANTGARLHLIRPLGFTLEDSKLRRAGLDYHEWAAVRVHDSLTDYLQAVQPGRLFAMSTRGQSSVFSQNIHAGDGFLFGPETRGLPDELLAAWREDHILRLPMKPESRSLNLSNAVAVTVYEAWRQLGFSGGR